MSSHADVLVFRVKEPVRIAADVLKRLVKEKIVKPMPRDFGRGSLGHVAALRAHTAVEDPSATLSGLEICLPGHIELFNAGVPWVTCPACYRQLEEESFLDHLRSKNAFLERKLARCPGCSNEQPIEDWVIHDGAFGNLALYFWEWMLRDDFIHRIQEWAASSLVLVHVRV